MLLALLFTAALATEPTDGLGTRLAIDPTSEDRPVIIGTVWTNDLRSPLVFDAVAYAVCALEASYGGETTTDEPPMFGDEGLLADAVTVEPVPPALADAVDAVVDLFDSNVALGGPDTTSRFTLMFPHPDTFAVVCSDDACVVLTGESAACEAYDHPDGTILVCE